MGGRYPLIALVVALTVLPACSHYGTLPEGSRRASGGPQQHLVRRGDTLFSIAWAHGLDYRAVAHWNGIPPPYTIYPGQRLTLVPRRPAQTAAARPKPAAVPPARPTAQAEPAPRPPAELTWRWPTEGRVIQNFREDGAGKKGIAIAGKAGQPVYAAAAGRVVYSGSGLLGYGRLIIIRHDDRFLSAYAHNRRLRVSENDEVRIGQHIADMGSSGTDRTLLHFEIRRDGVPINPLTLLPRQP